MTNRITTTRHPRVIHTPAEFDAYMREIRPVITTDTAEVAYLPPRLTAIQGGRSVPFARTNDFGGAA